MQKKLMKIGLVLAGIILAWVAVFLLFGNNAQQSKTTLEFWSVFDTSEQMEPLLEDFTAQTGVKVNYRSFTDLRDYRDALLIELASGEGPDVFAIHNTWIPKYKKFLKPLPAEIGYSLENVATDFVDAVADTLILETSDGVQQLFGLPMYLDSLAVFYNKTYFRNILSKAYPAPELTWNGLRSDAIGLTQVSSGESTGFQLAGIALGRADNITRGVDIFYTLYHQLGGPDLTAENTDGFYQPTAEALNYLTAFSRNSRNQEYSWSSRITSELTNKEISAFSRGRVAMIFGFSYYYDAIKAAIQSREDTIDISEVGVAPLPQIGDPLEGNPKLAVADFFTLAVAKSSQYSADAWSLILNLTSREAQEQYFAATKKPTSRRDLINSEKTDKNVGVFAEQAVYADTLQLADDEVLDTAVANVLDRIADGEITPTEGASELSTIFQTTISKSE
ncbi:MAG: extracellular solute-binding protein [Candidatus Peribacteraceae bacterium]|nr:extracellular solute-binding protein [Candidatus Peribacteraceae bacterium]